VAGFLKEVRVDEGERVSPGAWVARLEVPDLDSRLARKQAEVREAQARLRLLELGPRPEAVEAQRCRVERAQAWRDLARQDLARWRQILQEDLDRLEKQIVACRAEPDVARKGHQRAKALLSQQALGQEQYQEAEGKYQADIARWEQARAEKRIRQAKGTLEAEAEQARREKELADAQANLKLLVAGSRPEEIDAERATLARLYEEARYLDQLAHALLLSSPVAGVVTTPRLRERVGHYLREGELICTFEDRVAPEVELTLSEENTARVQPGQEVGLKARALPFESFTARVDRKASVAARGEQQSTVAIYCRLHGAPAELQPGMTGYDRVYTGRRRVSAIALDRAVRFLRTEFLW
jgi:multidrug resistance efflux pump